jgi:hypothetical protein
MPGMQAAETLSKADSVSLSHRKEVVKEGQEPPGDINCHDQREQHCTAVSTEFGLLCLHTAAACLTAEAALHTSLPAT